MPFNSFTLQHNFMRQEVLFLFIVRELGVESYGNYLGFWNYIVADIVPSCSGPECTCSMRLSFG